MSSLAPQASAQRHPVLTVSQLTRAIKLRLESAFPNVRIQGEVSNLRRQSSGHLYFTLKDSHAQISAVMFRGDAQGLRQLPREGDQVVVEGQINVYPPRGNYQMVVRHLSPVGVGQLLLLFEELKQKLYARGWFEQGLKKPLPSLPQRIGVVSSPTGAAIQDMLNVLTRRFSGFQLILNPVLVQGAGSAQQVAQAIHQFNQHKLVDVIIVARGGGSIEDLWAFNEEIVASAVFHSEIPIISGVGHETDTTLCDFVADVRAPTPSAAAEIVIGEKLQHLQRLQGFQQHLRQLLRHRIDVARQQLRSLERQPVLASPYQLLGPALQRLDDARQRLDQGMGQQLQNLKLHLKGFRQGLDALEPGRRLQQDRQRLTQLTRALDQSLQHRLQSLRQGLDAKGKSQRIRQLAERDLAWRKEKLAQRAEQLQSINPKNLLQKGYSIVLSEKDRSVVKSVTELEDSQAIRLLLADGEAQAVVSQRHPSAHDE